MSIAGPKGASNGWKLDPIAFSTDDDSSLKVTLSGSANAQYYVDLMDPAGAVVFATLLTSCPMDRTFPRFLWPGPTLGTGRP